MDAHNLALRAAIISVTVHLIAEQTKWISQHRDQTAVDKGLQDTGACEPVGDLKGLGVMR